MRKILVAFGACCLLLGAACSTDDAQHAKQDASVQPADQQDNRPPHIINFTDDYMNVEVKCFGVNGIYAHTREASPVVIPNDPMCSGGGR